MSKWEWKKLKDICVFIGDGDWIESKDQSSKGIRLIQTGNIGNGIYLEKKERAHYISEKTFHCLHCTEIFSGDCLISRLPEPIGRACVIPNIAEKMITAVDCTIVRFCEFIVPNFFIYYAQSDKYFSDVKTESTGATRKRISRKNLENIKIPIPSLSEQNRIVKFLDEEFSKIDTLKTNAETNLKNAKELFEASLEKELNPRSRHSERSEESSAELPSGWEWVALNNVCKKIFAGGDKPQNCSKKSNEILSVPVYANAIENEGLYGYTDKAVVKEPCLTISARGTIGFTVKRTEPFVPIIRLIVLIPKMDVIDLDYFFFSVKHLKIVGNGTSIPQLTVPLVKQYTIPLPPLSVQKEIVARLDILFENVKRLEANYKQIIADCDELKKSILKKTFEGES